MIYPFKCPACGNHEEVMRCVDKRNDPLTCIECSIPMERVFTVPLFHVKQYDYYDRGLGKYINTSGVVEDTLKRIGEKEGREFECIGNESPKVEKKKSEYKFTTSEMRDIGAMTGA